MIVVVARIETDDERRDALIAVGEKVAAASRQEAGCLDYRLYEETERRNHFVVVEHWVDQVALEEHFTTPHIAEFMPAVGPLVASAPDVQFHTVASSQGLADVTGG